MTYYERSHLLVVNENEYSGLFKSSIGVRLLEKIKVSNLGVKYKFGKIEIICYADDILVLSQTKIEMQKLLGIADKIGNELEIKFNAQKTNLMVFNQNIKRTNKATKEDLWQGNVTLGEKTIQEVKNMRYLGIELSEDNKNKLHIEKRKKLAIGAVVKLKSLGIWNEFSTPFLKAHLYKTFIRPLLMYGMDRAFYTKNPRCRCMV